MGAASKDEVVGKANALLDALGINQRALNELQDRQDKQIKAITDANAPEADRLKGHIDELQNELVGLWEKHSETLTDGEGKTAVLRAGTINEKLSPPALKVPDKKKLLKYLKRKRALLRFTKKQERVADLNAIKKDKAFVAAAPPEVMYLEQARRLYLKPNKSQLEVQRDLHPTRVVLPENND